ncbi:uncharacterized protein LOC104583906 [Brachypodium distachyon]|uniref:Chromo domain-containing protein n=2 Tax=Brachypodium distachyon TaxID=15368 RepID=A0A2K2CUK0_BRADI|nr:uncharacterized protein LOC104583906 [Brachypodium distachyon]PNT65709.1 hypothetical protein BRADI_3g01143v3 [Brachypodium distachyon]|eukprot:XP_014756520.1 uncharacterized protein LOC104583906 [Brachypodium distachyon]
MGNSPPRTRPPGGDGSGTPEGDVSPSNAPPVAASSSGRPPASSPTRNAASGAAAAGAAARSSRLGSMPRGRPASAGPAASLSASRTIVKRASMRDARLPPVHPGDGPRTPAASGGPAASPSVVRSSADGSTVGAAHLPRGRPRKMPLLPASGGPAASSLAARNNSNGAGAMPASGGPEVSLSATRKNVNGAAVDTPRLPQTRPGNAPPRAPASGSPTALVSATRNNTKGSVAGTPHLPTCGGPGLSVLTSSRNAPSPNQERCSTSLGNVMTPRSDIQQNGAAEETQHGVPKTSKNSASNALSRDSTRSTCPNTSSKKGTEELTSENGNVSNPSKKRKRLNGKKYLKLFRVGVRAKSTDAVVATRDRVGKESTSGQHVADSNFAFVQPRKNTNMSPQNVAATSNLAVEASDQPTGPARGSCLPSMQSVPISPLHYGEPKSKFGDGESIGILKEDSASGQFKVTPSDETDGNSNICVPCGTPGTLRYCHGKGCKNRYHPPPCIDPSQEDLYTGILFCTNCTGKRFHFGLHYIVDAIESVWDVKEIEGMQNSKEYLVKYRNLAHVHNRWVPEDDINATLGGPELISFFNKRNHTEKTTLKPEWTMPHRLLRKRLLMLPKLTDGFSCSSGDTNSYCTEWLVKWRDLGYDHATWELETLSCLCTPEADKLKENYEHRCEAAKQLSTPNKTKKVKQNPFQKLQSLPDGCHPDFDHDHLCSINHLREFWYRSHGGVLVDDKECVSKTVLFTMSVLHDVCQPFLIVTTPHSLSLWEDQFDKLAPLINVVVYDGGKDNLKLIRDLEFYDKRGCTMLQVLLSHPDAILEDIQPIARIGWEAIIADCYENSAPEYLEQLKQLSTDFRLLLLSSSIKDNLPEYMKLLAFLTVEQENGDYIDTTESDGLLMSEIRFSSHIAYDQQTNSSKYLEHWVPAVISQKQLAIYCSTMLSYSSVLQSQRETDSVGALRSILISLSKCCDDPYLVGEFLEKLPVNNHERMETIDARVHSCGKLLLLEKMLKEIRNNRLRVIILFQSGGAAGNPIGDILEGVVHHRFGRESYERFEDRPAREKEAVAIFNDKSKGRFVFLIESRSCLSNIELSSIDAIIIYNSDWNPLNDLKALQKIKIESRFKYVSIFRLYTPFTMEEKRLVLAKQGMPITNIQDITCTLSHSLISWAASFLFTRLDELQQENYASKSSERDTHFMDKVISEFLTRLPTNVEDNTKLKIASISRANMSGKYYSRNITLIGEKERIPALDGDPAKFWLHLLDGKSPCWSYICEPSQSSCRMLQNMEESAKVTAEETGEARRKRRKIDEILSPFSRIISDSGHNDTFPADQARSRPAVQPLGEIQQNLGVKKLMSTPKNLHLKLKQELSKLIKVLQLPDNVRLMAEQFLEYLLKNHLVTLEPVDILHAFNIALCCCAASFVKYQLDQRESLALAKQCLSYECNEGLIAFMYIKLRVNFEGRNDECHIVESSVPDCQPPSNDGLLMEITTVQNTVPSEPISAQAMQNEPVKTSVDSGRGLASDPVDLTENGIHCSSDGIGLPRAGCSPSVIPANDDSIGQESLTGEHRNTEHVERDNIANPSMLLGGTVSVVKVVSASNDGTLDTDQVCLELPILASSQSPETLVETQADLSSMSPQQSIELSAQQNVVFSQRSPAEEELSGLLETQVNQDLQLEIQPSMLLSDNSPIQRMHSNDRSQTCCEPDRSTSLSQGGAATSDHLGELRMQVKAKNDDNIAADTVQSGSPTYTAHCAVTSEVEIQICQSSMPAEQSTFLPAEQSTSLLAQQSLATSRHTPAEAEPAGILGTEAAWDLRPEVQPSTSMRDSPGEAAGAGILCVIAAQDLQPEMQSSTSTQDVPFERSCLSGMPELQSLTVHQSVEPSLDPDAGLESLHVSGMVTAHDLQQEVQQTSASMLAEQSTSLPAQQNLSTSRQPPAEAEPAGILGTEAAWDLQPGVQPSTSMQDQPAEEGQAGILGATAARNLQPEMQSSTSTQDVPSERTCLPGMAVLQTPTVHQSVEPSLDLHAGVESAHTLGMVIAHDLQSEIQSSDSMPEEQSILPAQHILVTSRHPPTEAEPAGSLGSEAAQDLQPLVQSSTLMCDQPAEAEGAGILGAVAAQDLQSEMQPSTSKQGVSFERTCLLVMAVPQSIPIHRSVEPSRDPHASHTSGMVAAHDQQSETQLSVSMQDRPAEEGLDMLGTTAAQDLQLEMRSSTTDQQVPHERTHSEERRQVDFQPNMAPRPGQPTGLPHVTTLVFNNPILSEEPLKNELDRFNHCYTSLSEHFEQKKSLLLEDYRKVLEDLRKLENTFLQQKSELIDLYMKVCANQSVAENFRRMFTPSSASQGRSLNPVMEQQLDSSSATQTSVSPVTSSSGILLPVSHSAPSSSRTAQLQPAIPSNLYGATSSPSVPVPASVPHGSYGSTSTGAQPCAVQPQPILPGDPYRTVGHSMMTYLPHGSYRSAGAQPHAPAPHLQQLSMRLPYPYATHANQQHVSATPVGAISWEQYAAGMTGNFAATSSQASGWQESMANFLRSSSSNPLPMAATQQSSDPNIVLGSTTAPLNSAQGSQHAPSLVHHPISSASRLRPAHPESLLPSGWRESMANFLQSSSSNPLSMAATQQSSDPNIVLGSATALLNAAAGSQHAGAQIAGDTGAQIAGVTGSQSALPNAHLPARLGLTGSPADTSASPAVVCLSDDDDEQ